MSIRAQLLADIETFLARSGMEHTKFGKECLNDPAFVTRLRLGADVRTKTIERIQEYIERKRPLARRRKAEVRSAA